MKDYQKIIKNLFGILFFLVPLILWPFTSELFEFNKMVVVYIFTTLIVAFWALRSIKQQKFIFSRTILDIPLLVFLGSQFIATLLSIDPQTSFFGYYSRFNGGLLSTICYTLLYWAFVSNIDKGNIKKLIGINFISAALVSFYGVLERLGIDKNIWQQDVQHRVFSSLGQPNWLAAWLVALIPLVWVAIVEQKSKKIDINFLLPYAGMVLYFSVLLFTGSRSGLLGFAVATILFWGFIFIKTKFKHLKKFLIINALLAFVSLILGTQFTPSIFKIIKNKQISQESVQTQPAGTVLENGGTESGTIRKIVWQGAIDVWKNYPVFGTGAETFAYSYYLYRPVAHNLTSEWDFIYNKAHNEYLNYLANTGTVGFLAYFAFIFFAVFSMFRYSTRFEENENEPGFLFVIALIAGFVSILVTNFFGFSVVPVQLLFFLYPAFAFVATGLNNNQGKYSPSKQQQKALMWFVFICTGILIYFIARYWYADTLYSKGLNFNKINRQDLSYQYLAKAIKLEPNQSIFYAEQAKAFTNLAYAYAQANDATSSSQLSLAAIDYVEKAINLSPANLNHKRTAFGVFITLSSIDPIYKEDAKNVLLEAIKQAPTHAKFYYNLGLIYAQLDQNDPAFEAFKKAVELKPDYEDARLAYAELLIYANQKSEAKFQLEYILTNINPKNSIAKQDLESIK